MFNKRRFSLVIIAVILTVSLSACAGDDKNSLENNNTTDISNQQQKETESPVSTTNDTQTTASATRNDTEATASVTKNNNSYNNTEAKLNEESVRALFDQYFPGVPVSVLKIEGNSYYLHGFANNRKHILKVNRFTGEIYVQKTINIR